MMKNVKPEKKQKQRSIAMEMSVLFIGLLLLIMVAMLVMNNAYLTQFYELRLQHTLEKAYRQVDAHVSSGTGVDTDYFENEFRSLERSGIIALVYSRSNFYYHSFHGDKDSANRVENQRKMNFSLISRYL